MCKLLLDLGNTSAKVAVGDGRSILHAERLKGTWEDTFARLKQTYPLRYVVRSSVAGKDEVLDKALVALSLPVVDVNWNTPCPIKPLTHIPEGYGADRLAADVGAVSYDAQHALLVVDAGTCITYDLFSESGELLGGTISPGVQLRLRAMYEHTALLPLVQAEGEAPLMGMDTETCLLSGAIHGVRFEVEGFIRALREQHPLLRVFLTGGNAFVPSSDLQPITKVVPQLVLEGLNQF